MEIFLVNVAARDLSDAIFRTIAFFDVLDYCLTVDEVCDRLIGFRASRDEVLLGLAMCSEIEREDEFYFLKGRSELVKLRVESEPFHRAQWKKVERWRWIFSLTPFLKQVYVCNTLGMTQARPGSDIDLFIITKRNRLFLVRTWLLILTQLFGLRRHGKQVEGRFCLSFFVDEDHMDLSELLLRPYDIYFAYWLLLLKPVRRFSPSLLGANEWMERYFSGTNLNSEKYESTGSRSFFSSFLDSIESILAGWQLRRARAKFEILGSPQGVVLEKYCLKFHDQDMRNIYRQRWEKRITAL